MTENKAKPLQEKDLELLRRIDREGPSFMKHHAHEARAHRLSTRGLLLREESVFSYAQAAVQYRNRYTISPFGRERIQ